MTVISVIVSEYRENRDLCVVFVCVRVVCVCVCVYVVCVYVCVCGVCACVVCVRVVCVYVREHFVAMNNEPPSSPASL